MRQRSLAVCVALLSIQVALLLDGHCQVSPDIQSVSLNLTNADIRVVVEALRTKLRLPLCFEMEDLDPVTQGITAREMLASLKQKNASQNEIASMEQITKDNPDSIVDWKLPRYDFSFEKSNIREILTKVFEKFTNYTYKFDNTYLLVLPKNSTLDFEIKDITLPSGTINDALAKISPFLSKNKISVLPSFGAPQNSDPLQFPTSPLLIKADNGATFLTRLCQTSQPLTAWSLLGMKGSRILTFQQIGQ